MKKHLSIILIIFISYLLPTACQTPQEVTKVTNEPISIELAHKWFNRTIGSSNSGARVGSNVEAKTPNWSKASYYQFPFGTVVSVPLNYQNNYVNQCSVGDKDVISPAFPISNSNLDNVIFYKSEEGDIKERILRVIPDQSYLIKSQGRKLKVPFEGLVIITDWNDKVIDGIKYVNGKAIDHLAKNVKGNNGGRRAYTCWTIYRWSCASGDGGETWFCSSINSESFCSADDAYPFEVDYDNGNYYGGGNDNSGTSSSDNSASIVYGKVDPSSFIFSPINSLVKAAAVKVGLSSASKGTRVDVYFNLQVQIPNSQGGSIANMQNMAAAAAEYATRQVLFNPDQLYLVGAETLELLRC